MSSRKPVHIWTRRRFVAAATTSVAAALAGCGFQPVYGDGGFDNPTTVVDQRFAMIDVAPAEGRVGQRLRNELLFRMGRGGNPSNVVDGSQTLFLRVTSRTNDVSISNVSGRPRGSIVTVTASYHLVEDGSGAPQAEIVRTEPLANEEDDELFENVDAAERTTERVTLTRGEGVLYQGRRFRQASFDWIDQRFANDRAEIDAQNRAATELAQDIYLELAAFLKSQG